MGLKLDWTKLSMKPKWYDIASGELVEAPADDGAFLFIRPYPADRSKVVITEGGMVISGKQQKEIFDYCLVDWKGIADAEDKELKCTDEVKKAVFEYKLAGIPDFVIQKSRDFNTEKTVQEKNLPTG